MAYKRFGKISSRIWQSSKFSELPSDTHRLLYFYLHTCIHCNLIGMFEIPLGYILSDFERPDNKITIERAMEVLSESGLISWDKEYSLVVISNYFAFSPIGSLANIKKAEDALKGLPQISIAKKRKSEILKERKKIMNNFATEDNVDFIYNAWNIWVNRIEIERGIKLTEARNISSRLARIYSLLNMIKKELMVGADKDKDLEYFITKALTNASYNNWNFGLTEKSDWVINFDYFINRGKFLKLLSQNLNLVKEVVKKNSALSGIKHGGANAQRQQHDEDQNDE